MRKTLTKNLLNKQKILFIKKFSIPHTVTFNFYPEDELKNVPLKQHIDYLIVSCPIKELYQKNLYLKKYIENILGKDKNSEYREFMDDNTLIYLLNTTFQKVNKRKNALKNCREIIKNNILKKNL